MVDTEQFKVTPGSTVLLRKRATDATPGVKDEATARKETEKLIARLNQLQELLYAEKKHSLLIGLQAMDAGGKDGLIRHVFTGLNTRGCQVVNFKEPSQLERDHDFLWKAHHHAPPLREIAIFNRTHYEAVLAERVRKNVPKKVWMARYDHINNFERLLTDGHTHILKFFLHISKEEQLERFKKRLNDPLRHGELKESDFDDRELWDEFHAAFEDMLARCSTDCAPWYIIPADRKWYRNLVVAQIVVDYLESLNMKARPVAIDIEKIRQRLV